MTTNLVIYLVLHVMFGASAIIFLSAYVLGISKKEPDLKSLKSNSIFAFASVIAAWIMGGAYYLSYYGNSVKPLILKGQYPWIHTVVMEAKEHVFLFLPFATLSILAITVFHFNELKTDKSLRLATLALSFITVSLAMAILISGIAISGAVKR